MIQDWNKAQVELLARLPYSQGVYKIKDEYGAIFYCIESNRRHPDGDSALMTPGEFRRASSIVLGEIEADLDLEQRIRRGK